jgi:aromatic-L-amino-acid decarboxylase
MTPEEMRRLGHEIVDFVADYRARVEERPVMSTVEPGSIRAALPVAPPGEPEPFSAVMEDLERIILPGLSHWQHPSFLGYFPSNGDPSSVLGDWLSTGLGVLGLSWQSSPALSELEETVCDWLRQMVGLSESWTGVIGDTASTSTLVALVCARERTSGYSLARGGLQGGGAPLVVYTSTQSHSSVEKAALLAGFGRDHVRPVPVDARYAMRADALDAMIAEDLDGGRIPCAIVGTSGTTACTAFDPIAALAERARAHGAWLHVDAAMAGSAMILPEMRELWDGIEGADSLVINAHKWLGAAFDCSLYYVRDSEHLVRVMSTNPSYLASSADGRVKNLRDWGIPLGRRFRALKLWLLIRDRGISGLQARLRRDLENARWLAAEIGNAPGWKVVAPMTLQTVCVRHEPEGLSGDALDAHTRAWAEKVNRSGATYVTPATLDGRWMVRLSVGAIPTERRHLEAAWAAIRREAEALASARNLEFDRKKRSATGPREGQGEVTIDAPIAGRRQGDHHARHRHRLCPRAFRHRRRPLRGRAHP